MRFIKFSHKKKKKIDNRISKQASKNPACSKTRQSKVNPVEVVPYNSVVEGQTQNTKIEGLNLAMRDRKWPTLKKQQTKFTLAVVYPYLQS